MLEVSMAMGLAAILALVMMKGSLLAVAGNQWTIMEALTDAFLTHETALANRIPLADLVSPNSLWPDSVNDSPSTAQQTVSLGKLYGGRQVNGQLIRYRLTETPEAQDETGLSVWRLHSVLSYTIGDHTYVKSRTTLRSQ